MSKNESQMTRREALRHVSAGTLLAMGLWPGLARAEEGGRFRFVVVNDIHYMSEECGAWLRQVIQRIKTDKPEFCIVAGDLADHGTEEELAAVREILKEANVPVPVVIGNHDYASLADRVAYEKVFPGQMNHDFEHKGWQFIGLDTTEGTRYDKTSVADATLQWLDARLPKLDPHKPTVIFTHFPLGLDVPYRPLNADALLEKFREFNVRAVFSGHYHGYTERHQGTTVLNTNICCSLKRGNHDNTNVKGYFLCEANEQTVLRTLVQTNEA
jgi:3',5'-cyclic AMP phosphodiesterase CpdA